MNKNIQLLDSNCGFLELKLTVIPNKPLSLFCFTFALGSAPLQSTRRQFVNEDDNSQDGISQDDEDEEMDEDDDEQSD